MNSWGKDREVRTRLAHGKLNNLKDLYFSLKLFRRGCGYCFFFFHNNRILIIFETCKIHLMAMVFNATFNNI